MVIDFHAHFPRGESFEKLVDWLAEAGIDRICLYSAGEKFGHASNSEILEGARRHPERIIAFALVELGKDRPERVDEYAAQGFAGFKVTCPASSYDDEAFFPLYERMERSGLPLLAHTGILMRVPLGRGERINSRWMRPACLDAVLRSFPALNVVGADLGAPWHGEASMMARLHPNYYVDLTGAAWGGWRANKGPDFYRYHFFWPGAWDKVLFGTDILALSELVPSRQYHDRLIAALELPEEAVRQIYGGAAARLLKLGQ